MDNTPGRQPCHGRGPFDVRPRLFVCLHWSLPARRFVLKDVTSSLLYFNCFQQRCISSAKAKHVAVSVGTAGLLRLRPLRCPVVLHEKGPLTSQDQPIPSEKFLLTSKGLHAVSVPTVGRGKGAGEELSTSARREPCKSPRRSPPPPQSFCCSNSVCLFVCCFLVSSVIRLLFLTFSHLLFTFLSVWAMLHARSLLRPVPRPFPSPPGPTTALLPPVAMKRQHSIEAHRDRSRGLWMCRRRTHSSLSFRSPKHVTDFLSPL